MRFSEVIAAMHGEGGDWRAPVPNDWLQGRTVFGGLQAALAVRAMRGLLPGAAPLRTLQATFIAPAPAGELRVAARVLRSGKSATHIEADLYDGEQLACRTLGIFGLPRESALALAPAIPAVPLAADAARELPYIEGVTPAFTQNVGFRWAHGGFPFSGAREPRTQIYVRLKDEAEVDELQLIALADSIPSPGLSMLKQPAAASSLTWMLELLHPQYERAADGWWLMDAEVSAAHSGYLSQTATLWSPDRRAIAYSRQSVVAFA
ncbi:acyl-CoA thioesterase [Solimonas flava]|uniref:acyl-CoA thioesterase n=1 Tax=Solimonas flava TaxID=415849 RepID=UPI00041DCCD0|nr:thioesterase family protein [Solimonas flava]